MIPVTSSVVLVLLLALGVSASNSGRPLCRQPDDFVRDWSAKNDPERFWRCTGFGTAELFKCAEGLTFSERYAMCTIPGAPIGDIDPPTSLIECEAGEEIDLSGLEPFCTKVDCQRGVITYDPLGNPRCYLDASHIKLCPGASEDKRILGSETCSQPICDNAEYQSNKLFASADPTEFYRCANVNTPVIFKCHPGLCYDAQSQGCAWPATWKNVCA